MQGGHNDGKLIIVSPGPNIGGVPRAIDTLGNRSMSVRTTVQSLYDSGTRPTHYTTMPHLTTWTRWIQKITIFTFTVCKYLST